MIKWIISNDFTWKIVSFFLRFDTWLRFERSKHERWKAEEKLKIVFQDKIVRNGFVKGLKYGNFDSVGSSIFPKLLGSYEIELQPAFDRLKANDYRQIIDIGCAEGYYAVGLALQFSRSKVFAFDIDKKAVELCVELAAFNGLQDRVILNDECTPSTIGNFDFAGPSLLICDCEGYERELFTRSNMDKLRYTDLVIELHPVAARDVKEYLTGLFSATHDIHFVSSQDNNRKIFDFKIFMADLNPLEQLISVEEGRNFTMDWLIAESKSNKIKAG